MEPRRNRVDIVAVLSEEVWTSMVEDLGFDKEQGLRAYLREHGIEIE